MEIYETSKGVISYRIESEEQKKRFSLRKLWKKTEKCDGVRPRFLGGRGLWLKGDLESYVPRYGFLTSNKNNLLH